MQLISRCKRSQRFQFKRDTNIKSKQNAMHPQFELEVAV